MDRQISNPEEKPIMSLPNLLSMSRILLVPVFFLTLYYSFQGVEAMLWWTRGTLIFIVLSDFFDGYLARMLKETSSLGSVLDPMADKLFVTTSFILLAVFQEIPPWLAIVVVAKDVLIVLGWSCIAVLYGIIEVRPSMWGKFATGFQFATVCSIILLPNFFLIDWLEYITGVLTIIALLRYGYLMLVEAPDTAS